MFRSTSSSAPLSEENEKLVMLAQIARQKVVEAETTLAKCKQELEDAERELQRDNKVLSERFDESVAELENRLNTLNNGEIKSFATQIVSQARSLRNDHQEVRELRLIIQSLETTSDVVRQLNPGYPFSPEKFNRTTNKLISLADDLSTKSLDWKKLGGALMALGCVALVIGAAGLFAAPILAPPVAIILVAGGLFGAGMISTMIGGLIIEDKRSPDYNPAIGASPQSRLATNIRLFADKNRDNKLGEPSCFERFTRTKIIFSR